MDSSSTIAGQLHLIDDIAAELWYSWAVVGRGAILQIQYPQPKSAEAYAEIGEMKRICRKYSAFTVDEFAECILEAARKKQSDQYARLRLIDIEDQLNDFAMKSQTNSALRLNAKAPKWAGSPSAALDANWDEIWEESLRRSNERNERCRAFDHDYLDAFNEHDKEQIKIRDAAFVELKKRVVAHCQGALQQGQRLVRDEMIFRLACLFPKYVGDIGRMMGNASFDDLDAVANELYTMGTQGGHTRNMKRVSRADCSWAVYFDLYADLMGCKWPEFSKENRAPKDDAPKVARHDFIGQLKEIGIVNPESDQK
jgi:hypothetical protein